MKRVAIYLRSPLRDNLDWIEKQLAELQKLATVNGGTIVDKYVDYGCSGSRICRRPALTKMLRDCKKGKVDEVLILTRGNLAIDATKFLKLFKEIEKYGISLISMDYGKLDFIKDLSDLWNMATLRGYYDETEI